jgi:hypothetical protein
MNAPENRNDDEGSMLSLSAVVTVCSSHGTGWPVPIYCNTPRHWQLED